MKIHVVESAIDTNSVWDIIDSCSDYLVTIGFSHWKNSYTKEYIEKKVKEQDVYLTIIDHKPVGTITLDSKPPHYFKADDLKHLDQNMPTIYVSALGVIPEYQNRRIASKLMVFAENEAKRKHAKYIRFDCRAAYTELVRFYKNRGYNTIGRIIATKHNNEEYLLMEKRIK